MVACCMMIKSACFGFFSVALLVTLGMHAYASPTMYVAGSYYTGVNYIACYWVNGAKTDLTDGRVDAGAFSIFVK
jgi:hypothetical protein